MKEHSEPGRLELVVAEDRATSLPVAVLALVWAAMLLAWCLFAARMPGGPWCMGTGAVAHLVAGAFIGHRALRGAIGRTHLILDGRALVGERRPVPPAQRVEIPLAGLSSFGVSQRGEGLVIIGFMARPVERWTVEARLKPADSSATDDGGSVSLPVDLPSREEAERLARRLEQALVALRTPATYRE